MSDSGPGAPRRNYVVGQCRNQNDVVAHIYEGMFNDLIGPLCARGWNRANGFGFSIFRGNVGERGICRVCERRRDKGLGAVKPRERKTRWW